MRMATTRWTPAKCGRRFRPRSARWPTPKAWRGADMRRSGFSLLEMIVATAIMATLMTSVVVIVRSGYAIWNAQEADINIADSGNAVLRHFVRELRQATAVT